jgi:hypothetical protein
MVFDFSEKGSSVLFSMVGIIMKSVPLSGLLCFAMYIGTREVVWRRRGTVIVKWTVLACLAFFAVLILERLALML